MASFVLSPQSTHQLMWSKDNFKTCLNSSPYRAKTATISNDSNKILYFRPLERRVNASMSSDLDSKCIGNTQSNDFEPSNKMDPRKSSCTFGGVFHTPNARNRRETPICDLQEQGGMDHRKNNSMHPILATFLVGVAQTSGLGLRNRTAACVSVISQWGESFCIGLHFPYHDFISWILHITYSMFLLTP